MRGQKHEALVTPWDMYLTGGNYSLRITQCNSSTSFGISIVRDGS